MDAFKAQQLAIFIRVLIYLCFQLAILQLRYVFNTVSVRMYFFDCYLVGGWREREKAREESWGPPRDASREDDGGEREGDDHNDSDQVRDRRPPR